jgi:hypothetical protein
MQVPGPFTNRHFMLDHRDGSRTPTPTSNSGDEHRESVIAPNAERQCRTEPESLSSPRPLFSPLFAAHCFTDEDEQLGRLYHAVIKVSRHCSVPPPGSDAARSHLAACARGEEDDNDDEEESGYGARSAAGFPISSDGAVLPRIRHGSMGGMPEGTDPTDRGQDEASGCIRRHRRAMGCDPAAFRPAHPPHHGAEGIPPAATARPRGPAAPPRDHARPTRTAGWGGRRGLLGGGCGNPMGRRAAARLREGSR